MKHKKECDGHCPCYVRGQKDHHVQSAPFVSCAVCKTSHSPYKHLPGFKVREDAQ